MKSTEMFGKSILEKYGILKWKIDRNPELVPKVLPIHFALTFHFYV